MTRLLLEDCSHCSQTNEEIGMADEEKTDATTSEPRPGVTITKVTSQDADTSVRKLSKATAPFFRVGGPLAARHTDGA